MPAPFYRAAEKNQKHRLAHIKDLSLGEVEHVVRLSLGQRNLLEHFGDWLRPSKQIQRSQFKKGFHNKADLGGEVGGATGGGANHLDVTGPSATWQGGENNLDMTGQTATWQSPTTLGPVPPAPVMQTQASTAETDDPDNLVVALLHVMRIFPYGMRLLVMKKTYGIIARFT